MSENDRLRDLRKHLKMTQETFADRIGLKRNSYSQIETGVNTLTPQVRMAILREFHVSDDWLKTGQGEMFVQKEGDLIDQIAAENGLDDFGKMFIRKFLELDEKDRNAIKRYMGSVIEATENGEKVVPMPKPPRKTVPKIYLGKNAAAGTFVESFENLFHGTIEVVEDQLSERADYCIGVSGDSMSPLYEDGDILLVERPDNHLIEYGEIGIFQYMNTLYVKKLGRDCLESINPDYKPLPNNGDVRCLGRVIGVAERP